MKKRLSLHGVCKSFILGVLFLFPSFLLAFVSPGSPAGYVNDFANVLTVEQKSFLENKLRAFNASTTNEIAVVIVKSLQGDYVEHYAVELFKAWGIGTKRNDNGVLLLVAVDDHKMRIEVGYGLEGALTDILSSQIIREDLTPAFKRNDFYGGLDIATGNIIKATKGEYVSTIESTSSGKNFLEQIVDFFAIGFIVLQIIVSFLARSKSWWAGGVCGLLIGVFQSYITHAPLHVFGIITSIYIVIGLVLDYFVSKGGGRFGGGIGGGLSGGRFSGGGSSFGGFGGGRSGGGGASGSW